MSDEPKDYSQIGRNLLKDPEFIKSVMDSWSERDRELQRIYGVNWDQIEPRKPYLRIVK